MNKHSENKKAQVMSLKSVFDTMSKVARGEEKAPDWAGQKVYVGQKAKEEWDTIETSSEQLTSLTKLYSENEILISLISTRSPNSIAELAKISKRAESNVSRTIAKFVKLGIVDLIPAETGKAKRPVLLRDKISLNLDLLTGKVEMSVKRT
jgi:predicted transcriptional regulator